MENEDSAKFNTFSGPLTLAEIKKSPFDQKISCDYPKKGINRGLNRVIINSFVPKYNVLNVNFSDLMPSRNIYFDYPELHLWKQMNLSNLSDDNPDSSMDQYSSYPSLIIYPDKNDISPSTTYTPQSHVLQFSNDDVQCDNKKGIIQLFTDSVIIISDDEDLCEDQNLTTSSLKSNSDLNGSSILQLDDEFGTCNLTSTDTEEESMKFNDTLEEMEMFLKQGLDPKIPEIHNTEMKVQVGMDSFKKPLSSKIPVTRKKNVERNTPTTSKTWKFKDVVSPVAIYIKNSPHVPQIQNVPLKLSSPKNLFPTQKPSRSDTNNKEDTLPQIIYAPPRKVVKSTEQSLKLPLNIQRHLPTTPHIIKHTGRVLGKVNRGVEEKLLECDLSLNNVSDLNSTVPLQEISVHKCKNVFIM
ncbi:hypothetical protein RI129_011659 [Pyrocoelia pectoralis]|uniref:Uncharacterized protein n=1 Tax=Pyrocoelia pectoralis TaxID=417401 RepID=A0AAN7ZD59_9COLE